MKISETLYVTKRDDWRNWLKRNHQTASDIWLVWPKKSSGKPRISYNDAVEEALCFGWIDSIMKSLDSESSAQRFSPRKTKGNYSQPNIERLRKMRKEKKLLPEIETAVREDLEKEFDYPQDIIASIKANRQAWTNYQNFSPVYTRLKIAFIEGARSRPEEFEKRLNHFIAMTEKNKQYGFGGIESYF